MLEQAFDEYANNYDLLDNNLKSRYNHSYRVMKLSEKYATELGWSKDDIELAKLIGLIHDFGRFEQYKVYKSFIDSYTVDHADYSVQQLFEKNEIIRFTDRKEDYELIKFAIKNHNKKDIPKCYDERMVRFAKLIRDADKVDIMYVLSHEIHEQATNEKINEEIIKLIKEHKLIPNSLANNINDRIVVQFGFSFDLNNDIVLNDYKKNLEEFYKDIEYNEIFKDMYDEVIRYIDERIENNVRK